MKRFFGFTITATILWMIAALAHAQFNTGGGPYNTGNITTINTTTINLSGKAQFNQIIITNGFFSKTNVWVGPTNTLDMSIYEQDYVATSHVSFTGFINYSNSLGSEVKFYLVNNQSTNITAFFAAGCVDRDHVTSQIVTNGTTAIIWFGYTPAGGGHTNDVFNDF